MTTLRFKRKARSNFTFLTLFLYSIGIIAFAGERDSESSAQTGFPVKGFVIDGGNERERLPGATVYIPELSMGVVTSEDGMFTLDGLPAGRYEMIVSFIGYPQQRMNINVPAGQDVLRIFMEPGGVRMDEVVVTASPTRSPVNYQSVQAFNTADLIRKTSVSLGEMLDGEPGLSSRSFGGGPARPVIRGFDGERLVVLENGERMGDIQSTAPDHAITLDPLGMSRVEVVRGPASLLYGSSALGGVINLFTEDAPTHWDEGFSGGAAFHGATVNNLMTQSVGLRKGTKDQALALRFIRRTAGETNTPDGVLPNTQIDSYTASAGWSFRSNRFKGGISGRYYENHYGVPEFASLSDPANPGMYIEEEPEMEIRINRFNVQAHASLTLNTFIDEIEGRLSYSSSLQEEGEPDPLPEELELEIQTQTVSTSLLFLHRPFAFFDRGTFGFNLHRRYQEVDGVEAYHPGEDIYNLAFFTFQEVPLNQSLRMQFGIRAEQEWLSSTQNRWFPEDEKTTDETFNVVGSVGFNIRPASIEGWETGIQIARAHRNPTILEKYADGWHAGATRVELGDPTLKSEYGYGIDLFSKYANEKFQIEVSGFVNRIDNYVALRTLDPVEAVNIPYRVRPDREFPNTVQFFGADALLAGFDLRGSYFVFDNLRVDMGVDYVQGTRRDGDKDPLPFMPPLRTNIGLNYVLNQFTAGSNFRYVSAQSRVPSDELPTDGYALVRLETGYRFSIRNAGTHSINFRVDNALNTSYQDHLSVVRRFPNPQLGPAAPERFNMPGRNFNLVYRIVFG
ncbi:TonB-dependent receptor [Natronoflexus pectinivorans]|uniref:Iron complex outermembrane receptor protein n=1 Tax=Natronoflexus pectinivorans TaxID=682526 RepID=A0A4R2GLG5_9BACT|nr:TonB-dependent receptor [Natronoflexus pectinivorans]TCO09773.1 iron complex outermembrane receptor protein [Natronoflexus pectinivorans]